VAARALGLRAGAPVFVPFLGASIALKDAPRNAWVEAVVGIGGPVFGTIGGVACVALGFFFQSPLFFALASATFFLQLFNLVPIVPLDGGRVVGAISPWLWVVGLCLLVPYLLLTFSGPGLYILIIVATSLPRVWRSFRDRNDPEVRRYFEAKPWQRVAVAASYFGLLGFLGVAWILSHAFIEGFA
jgi:Zn-dependent protease